MLDGERQVYMQAMAAIPSPFEYIKGRLDLLDELIEYYQWNYDEALKNRNKYGKQSKDGFTQFNAEMLSHEISIRKMKELKNGILFWLGHE